MNKIKAKKKSIGFINKAKNELIPKIKGEFSIMPESDLYSVKRIEGYHRHEVFYGTGNREKSIKLGLVVFLPPALHNASDFGVHFNREFDLQLKKIGQKTAMNYYNLSTDDFIKEFGKSYL